MDTFAYQISLILNTKPSIMIKKTLAITLLILTFVSCDKIDELTKFNIDYTTNFTIQATTLLGTPFDIVTPETTTNSESEFENNNTNSNLVESVKLTTLRLDLQTPASGDFDFLNEIFIYITADGLPEQLIASKVGIPENGARSLTLDIENVELEEYIKKDSYRLRTETTTDQTIESDHEIEIYTKFKVDAEILGV